MIRFAASLVLVGVALLLGAPSFVDSTLGEEPTVELGNFSISLAVKDIALSKEFYQTLGFEVVDGDESQGWLILRNGTTKVGLFQGKFEGNILTFNPGWSGTGESLDTFTDVRELQKRLLDAGQELAVSTDPEGTGPAHIVFYDPDGNCIMLDQHVPAARAR